MPDTATEGAESLKTMANVRPNADIDLVVFDVAGTLIQITDEVADAFTAALESHGIEMTPEELLPWRGASKRQTIRHFVEKRSGTSLSDEQIEQVHTDFLRCLRERFEEEGLHPIPGVEDTLAWLRARGIRIALNTGFDREIAELIARAVQWDKGVVDAVVCGDDVPQGRPAPFMIFHAMEDTETVDVRRVAVVGDTTLDLEAGWNASVGQLIGVLSGAHSLERLSEAPHTHILASVAELRELWEQSSPGR